VTGVTSGEQAPFRTVREATLDLFRELGMTTVFSNPSHSEMKLFESWPDDFRFVMGLQEATVVSMADGYAQASMSPALVIINGGPGLGNAMGSVYTAASAHTPMVILGGQQARKLLQGEPFLNATEATSLPRPYIKWAAEPARPQDVPALLLKAYHIANQAPQGPVFVAVPEDDWVRPAETAPLKIRTVESAVVPDPAVLTGPSARRWWPGRRSTPRARGTSWSGWPRSSAPGSTAARCGRARASRRPIPCSAACWPRCPS
jgi:benzoylformate decarboxylase